MIITLPELRLRGRLGEGGILELFPGDDGCLVISRAGARRVGSADWALHCPCRCGDLSPDGKLLALAGETLHLWDLDSHQCRHRLNVSEELRQVRFSPDGKVLAGVDEDFVLRFWDVATWDELRRLEDHSDPVTFSPRGGLAATVTGEQDVELWDLRSGLTLRKFPGHEQGVTAVEFSADGDDLYTGAGDGGARVWETHTGELLQLFQGHQEAVWSVAGHGHRLATGGEDGTIRLWDLARGAEIAVLEGHEEGVWRVAFDASGEVLYSAGTDRMLLVWDVPGLQVRERLEHFREWVTALAQHVQAGVATGSMDGKIRLRPGLVGSSRIFEGHRDCVNDLAFSPDGARLASGSEDCSARLWEVATGTELLAIEHDAGVGALAFSPDGRLLGSGGSGSRVQVWDLERRGCLCSFPVTGVERLFFDATGATLTVLGDDGLALLFEVASG